MQESNTLWQKKNVFIFFNLGNLKSVISGALKYYVFDQPRMATVQLPRKSVWKTSLWLLQSTHSVVNMITVHYDICFM